MDKGLNHTEWPGIAPGGTAAGQQPPPELAKACARQRPATDGGRCVSPFDASVRPWGRRLRTANWQSPSPGTRLRRRPCGQLLASWLLWFPSLTLQQGAEGLGGFRRLLRAVLAGPPKADQWACWRQLQHPR